MLRNRTKKNAAEVRGSHWENIGKSAGGSLHLEWTARPELFVISVRFPLKSTLGCTWVITKLRKNGKRCVLRIVLLAQREKEVKDRSAGGQREFSYRKESTRAARLFLEYVRIVPSQLGPKKGRP